MYFIPPNPGNNPANPFYYRTMEEQRRELDKQVEGSSEGDIQEEQPGITAERQKNKMFSKPKPARTPGEPDISIGDDPKIGKPTKGPDFGDGSGPKITVGPDIEVPDFGDGSDDDDDEKKDDKKGKPKGKPKGPRPGAGGLGPRPSFGKAPGGPYNPGGRGRG